MHYKGRQGDFYILVRLIKFIGSSDLWYVSWLWCWLRPYNGFRSWICWGRAFGMFGILLDKRKWSFLFPSIYLYLSMLHRTLCWKLSFDAQLHACIGVAYVCLLLQFLNFNWKCLEQDVTKHGCLHCCGGNFNSRETSSERVLLWLYKLVIFI